MAEQMEQQDNRQAEAVEPDRAPSVPPPPAAPPAVPPPVRSRTGLYFFGGLLGCLVLVVGLVLAIVAFTGASSGEWSLSTSRVAVVPIDGEILEARETVEALERWAESPTVRAIVVRINSPGGAIAPSQEIYAHIRRIRSRSGKPIVASIDSVAASGGYYIAAACDQIVANPGSITGSIGVILQWLTVEDLVRWMKMKPETIVSGPLKATGSPFQELTEAERLYLQRVVMQLHSQFVRAVASGRKGKLSEAEVARLADGRIFTGEDALALKLVDRLGSLNDAVEVAGNLAGIRGEPDMIYPRKRELTLLELLTGSGSSRNWIERVMNRRVPRFLYLWEAGGAASVK